MAEDFLALRDIVVRHGDTMVLNIPELEIRKGEIVSLLGPNGAGKTTLLNVIGLLQAAEGAIRFRGSTISRGGSLEARRRMAMVFQDPLLLNGTVYQNAALGLKLRGLQTRAVEHRVNPWLERLGILSLAGRAIRTLSGGEAQRTSLARALVLEPEILLLDEPFSALDPTTREVLLRDFQKIVRESRITTVIVTHDREEAYRLADRVGVMKDGRLLQIGTRDEVFARPATEKVAEIVGIENRWHGVMRGCEGDYSLIDINGATLRAAGKALIGSSVVACLRSDCVAIDTANHTVGRENRIRGVISELVPSRTHQRLTIDCRAFLLIALIARGVDNAPRLDRGIEVTAFFDTTTVHLIPSESTLAR